MFNGSCRPTLVMEFSGRPKASATLATVIVRTDFLDINQCGNTTVDNIFLVTKYSCKIFVQSRVPSYNRSKSRMLQDLQLRSGVEGSCFALNYGIEGGFIGCRILLFLYIIPGRGRHF